jgi:maleamate amidohydrolase
MQESDMTARQLYQALQASPRRKPFGFGRRAALVNVDLQLAYTAIGEFPTAYATHPRQLEFVNMLAARIRGARWPVVWTYLAYAPDGSDCGVWGTRSDTPDSLQRICLGSRRAALDPRAGAEEGDAVILKKMPSAFHETNLRSLLTWHGVDTVIVTGGSTSGCVRATVVDSLSNGFRTIVPEECVADVHEGPHFANLYDMQAKYADVLPVERVLAWLDRQAREVAA